MVSDWKERLTRDLEPILHLGDPRPDLSAYHNMPYAVFRYPPEVEFAVRAEVQMLKTRLEQRGKRITIISLAECLAKAQQAEGMTLEETKETEQMTGTASMVDTFHKLLSEHQPLEDLVAAELPASPDPTRDIVFIVRAGALFPFYRTSSLLEQLQGKVDVPALLFYPGELDGVAGLKFMGVLDAEHNYRPKIY